MIKEDRLRKLEQRAPDVLGAPPAIVVPNIIEFALSESFLKVRLYPRQVTLLKLKFCSSALFTSYDRQVLAEWTAGFVRHDGDDGTTRYRGQYGVVADVEERIDWCRANGRGWFREIIMVAGRRGSKGYLGALACSYVLWHIMSTGDPQAHYGIPAGKQLHVMVFAAQQYQAQVNQWKDVVDVIRKSACFAPYIAGQSRDTLWLYSAAQLAAGNVAPKDATFVISAREATTQAGRGPATVCLLIDEMAHMQAGGANRPADEIYSAASPSTAQFRTEAMLYQASSPWSQQGKFYAQYLRGLAADPVTLKALNPDMLVVQLPSGELYRDWELTADPSFEAWPGGLAFPPLRGPIFDAADEARHRSADPHGYDVEFGAQWAASEAAYLPREDVDALFAPYGGVNLQMKTVGTSSHSYIAHADPSYTGANFAIVVAHVQLGDDGQRHVIIDLIRVWRPTDWSDKRINYEHVIDEIKDLLRRFRLTDLTFDQFNAGGLLQRLQDFARTDARVLGNPSIYERTATAPYNHRAAETFKAALSRRLVHAPYHDLADAELRNLESRNGRVNHPTTGTVTTSDIADCLMAITYAFLGDDNSDQLGKSFGSVGLSGSRPAHPLDEAFSSTTRTAPQGLPRGYNPKAASGGRFGRRRRL